MKFTCLQENLAKGLNIVTRATPVKSSLPILSNVLISAEDGRVKLSATNLETSITTYIGASVEEEGAITVPAKLLKEFVTNLSPSTLTVTLKDDILHISSERTKSKFNGVNPVDFPHLPEMPKKAAALELDPREFANAVSHVAFAAANDQARPVFTGVFLSLEKGILTIASSDGFRLSEKKLKLEGDAPDFYTIVPAKTLQEISKIFSNSEEPVMFVLNAEENLALFEAEDTLIAAQTLGGEYPNYKKIIPEDCSLNADFIAEEFLEAVKLTNVFSKEVNSAVKMKFSPKGTISVVSLAQESGEHESHLKANVQGEELEIAFNSKYLLDLLNNVKTDKITFKTKGSTTPCLFVLEGHESYLHVIAPMQVQG